MSIGQELLNVPFPEMVLNLAKAIAEGQYELDKVSCKLAKIMGDSKQSPVELPDLTSDKNETIKTSLIGAGFQPTFYQFTDTIIEVKMAISMTRSKDSSVSSSAKVGFGIASASVNASYSSKYSYSADGSSLLRTKITPLPPNDFMQRILDMKAQQEQHKFELKMKEIELKNRLEEMKIDLLIQKKEAENEAEINKMKKEMEGQNEGGKAAG